MSSVVSEFFLVIVEHSYYLHVYLSVENFKTEEFISKRTCVIAKYMKFWSIKLAFHIKFESTVTNTLLN